MAMQQTAPSFSPGFSFHGEFLIDLLSVQCSFNELGSLDLRDAGGSGLVAIRDIAQFNDSLDQFFVAPRFFHKR
jgi:hypothetical protein